MSKRTRGQNEGCIYERADGRWEAKLNLGYVNGKRRRKCFYAETRAEVQALLAASSRDRDLGLPVATERQTVGHFLDGWLKNSVRPSVRPRTYESYELTVRKHLRPALGNLRLEKLAPQHVQEMLNAKLKQKPSAKGKARKLSPRSVAYLRVVLRHALNQAMRFGLVVRNAAALTDPPKVERAEIRPLSLDQAKKLLDVAKGDRLEALYSVALALGLRRGEILGLRWAEDVDLDGRTIQIQQAIQRVGPKASGAEKGSLQAAEPKTERSRRTIALPDAVVRSLRAHRARQLQERMRAGARWNDRGLVFTTGIGTPLEPRNVHRHFKRMLKKMVEPADQEQERPESKPAEPLKFRFHDLRHSAASLLLAMGVPMRTVMEMLGHSSIALTADTYSHIAPAMLRDAADKMDSILTAAGA